MTNNSNYLKKAQQLIKKFDEEKDTEYLEQASIELQKVRPGKETNLHTLAEVRLSGLVQWLSLLQVIDGNSQPGFDANENVSINVPLRRDVSNEERKKAVEENNKKVDMQNMQVRFARLNQRLTPLAKTYIRKNYTGLPTDQLELKTWIEKTLKDPARKEDFLKLLVPILKK